MLMSKAMDLTIPYKTVNKEGLKMWIEKVCDRGAYAVETGIGGFKHYQVRVWMKTEQCVETMQMLFPQAHITPTHVGDYEYIIKTAREGGEIWTSDDEGLERYRNIELRGWQKEAYRRYKEQTERKILVVTDTIGNTGKSYLGGYIVGRYEGTMIPAIGDGRNLVQTVLGAGTKSGGFVIDASRMRELNAGFWADIEVIKNGFLYETRYQYSCKWIKPPRILVLTNMEFNAHTERNLSVDRWDVMRLDNRAKGVTG